MPVDVPLLRRRRVWASKIETTTGTPIAIGASDGVFNAFDSSILADIPFNRREGQGASVDPIPGVPGARGARVHLMTELTGKGAVGTPPWNDLLLAAGGTLTSQTVNFTTATMNTTTLTCGVYEDGWLMQASGVKLNWNLRGQTGNPAMSTWDGTGLWQVPTAVALIAPSYPTVIPPRVASATITIGGTAYKFSSFELDLGNEIVYREKDSDVTGYHAACIVNRNITLKVDPERVALGTKDWYADYLAGTEAAFSAVIGTVANNIITITAPKLQLAVAPESADRNGILIDQLTFQCNRSASAGDDSLVLVYS